MRMPSHNRWLAAALFVLASCGGGSSPSAPSTPSTPSTPATPAPPANPVDTWSATGTVTTIDSGAPIAGATVTPGWSLAAVTTDASGAYTLGDVANPPTMPYPVTLTADGMLTHKAWIQWATGARTGVNIGLIHNAAPFSLGFYQQFVRGTYDQPGAPFPILRWMTAPKFYIRTVDQIGAPIEQSVLDVIVNAINRAVPGFSGGRYTPAAIQMGTAARAPAVGWINVDIQQQNPSFNTCGDSLVGENPGQINLYEDVCSCAPIPGNVVMHEVGHALGYFHVNDRASVMYPDDVSANCAGALSAAETYHANIAYSRPYGNTDPDNDPGNQGVLDVRRPHIRVR
jgi:hypothetical protein